MFFDEEGQRNDVKAYHVNEYIQDISGEKFTAKDFRTWGGTKLAAEKLVNFRKKDDKKQRKKNITKMEMKMVFLLPGIKMETRAMKHITKMEIKIEFQLHVIKKET